jgi:hypothetical protein
MERGLALHIRTKIEPQEIATTASARAKPGENARFPLLDGK